MIILLVTILSVDSFAEQPLTLQDCISLARQNNPTLVQQKTSIERSNVGVTSAHSSYYPGVDLSSSYRNSGSSFGDRQGSYSTSIGLSYTIYDGGYRKAAVDAATAKVDVAKEAYHLSEDELILQVKGAFFKILQKQEQITLVQDVVKRRREDLVLINLKYEAGRESSPAVKEAEANVLQAEYDDKRAKDELVLAGVELNLLLGRPRRSEVVLEYRDAEIDFPPLESLIEEAMVGRPELLSATANTGALQAQVTQARSNYLPGVSFSSSYGLQGSELLDQRDNWGAGISVSLPIFDGFSRKAKVRDATLSLESQSDRIRELQQQIEEEVEQAYSTWELAQSIIEVNKSTLEAARNMYELTKLQYEQGKTSYFFLQQKETGLTQAETTQLSALYNLRVSAARLEKACGRTS
ncbi:MAG: TolC family protein [Candidatus Eisenbacteria bacterium]|nr:TolC family protein [Candidatus Eisenbacteria bacterium]